MGEPELRAALQGEGDTRVRALWQDAEAAVSARRTEIAEELARLREDTDRRLQNEVTGLRNRVIFAAQTRSLACRLHAEAALAERLLAVARQLLPELARGDRAGLWKALCAELPDADWKALVVTPADREGVRAAFPEAVVECDAALGGGLIASTADGTLRVDNSLLRRLLRAWPDLLPRLVTEVRQRVDANETAHADTAG